MYISFTTTSLGISNLETIDPVVEKTNAYIELSSNHSFEINKENLKKFQNRLFIHNYSPRPKEAFVLNIASTNEENYKLSKNMVLQNILLSRDLGSPYYSFHAGYASDISPSMMGTKITSEPYDKREEILEIFTNRCRNFSSFASKNGVRLLIENNVAGLRNKLLNKTDLLLLAHIDEIESFFELMYPKCGLLLDVAHLKVSAKNLNFNLHNAIKRLSPFVEGLHLSDNDGFEDTNEIFFEDSWFLSYLTEFKNLDYIAIETKKTSIDKLEGMYKIIQNNI